MIGAIIASPTIANISQSTTGALTTKIAANAIGRPGFILMDGNIRPDTKKYAATKELIYQLTCLLVYMAVITPVFKRGAFKLAKNHLFKNEDALQLFKNADQYLEYNRIAKRNLDYRHKFMKTSKFKKGVCKDLDATLHTELGKKNPEMHNLAKGIIEIGNIIGSIIGLAFLAPKVSQLTIHPVLGALGVEKKGNENKTDKKDNTALSD